MNNTPDKIATAAVKFDGDKPRLDLIPSEALDYLGAVLAFGAKKYAPHNWCKGFDWSRLIGSALRHINAFNKGEDLDLESGLSHIAHALACLAFLGAHIERGIGNDDRYKAPEKQLTLAIDNPNKLSDDDREALAASIYDAQVEFDTGKLGDSLEGFAVRVIKLYETRMAK